MRILTEQEIKKFLSEHDYDIRKRKDARWIDQKCDIDVCCAVADCIVNYLSESNAETFTANDIWFSNYACENLPRAFKKPRPDNPNAKSEYNKFFGQPIKMLAYSGILNEAKRGITNVYTVANMEMLEYIAIAEKFTLVFLQLYIEKVITDSGLSAVFGKFFTNPNKTTFETLKTYFHKFTVDNTAIGNKGSDGKLECGRIFPKILNPISYKHNTYGSEDGRISKDVIKYDSLMYNKDNFRDIYAEKPKGMTRREYEATIHFEPNQGFVAYTSTKAKRIIRIYNQQYKNGITELTLPQMTAEPEVGAIHHIFPESDFPTLAGFVENLIAITSNQHTRLVHPRGNTNLIDELYQYYCLICKADCIEENLTRPDHSQHIYEFNRFLYVISVGRNDDSFSQIEDDDYNGIKSKLAISYGSVC